MNHLKPLNKYFWKYRWRLLLGVLFIVISNYFGILAPQVTGYVVDKVSDRIGSLANAPVVHSKPSRNVSDPLVQWFTSLFDLYGLTFSRLILYSGIILLVLALLRGFFMFLMRQTIIVMSRHIEFDQKNEVFQHYQDLDAQFYKTHSTGDLMSRMAEDVSRVRMYTGPALMYLINLVVLISFSLYYMFAKDWMLSLYALAPLPVLAVTIYFVNTIIIRKSEKIQSQLSDLTTNAQESYSGIRVIKSYVQESAMFRFFEQNSEAYRRSAINLAKVEAIYFPSIGLLIGVSTLLTIMIGGWYQIEHKISAGTIAEFVVYINMLSFPVSALGWVASMIQRASASQKRLNEFLDTRPTVRNPDQPLKKQIAGDIEIRDLSFTYDHTGIKAIDHLNLTIRKGQKIALVGKTGSGKSTLAQLLLRMFDPQQGEIRIDGTDIREYDLATLRRQIGYISQEVFLFSDTIANNIAFGGAGADQDKISRAARQANVEHEILSFPEQYQTMVGERGVTLSGGQKQRVSIARALIKDSGILIFDDCLSAVDAKTEKQILKSLYEVLETKTAIIITHRIFSLLQFDQVVVMDEGQIIEQGTHDELLAKNGYYAELYRRQQSTEDEDEEESQNLLQD
ncbi:MAG TPA: ABC transporter ATP-binding protein [Chitinophagaceae bacterium]|nr:ABC transporter ATP-binding protein [Chitinophagaceae bacterium]